MGVQRQCTGSAGKITNCQVAVSLSVASRTEHVPIDFAPCLPRSWLDSPARREEARIPKETTFKSKTGRALDLVVRALENKIPARSC